MRLHQSRSSIASVISQTYSQTWFVQNLLKNLLHSILKWFNFPYLFQALERKSIDKSPLTKAGLPVSKDWCYHTQYGVKTLIWQCLAFSFGSFAPKQKGFENFLSMGHKLKPPVFSERNTDWNTSSSLRIPLPSDFNNETSRYLSANFIRKGGR